MPEAFEYLLKADFFFKESLLQRAQHSRFGTPDITLLKHEGRPASLVGKGTLATHGEIDEPSSNTTYKHAGTSLQSVIWWAEMTISLSLSARPILLYSPQDLPMDPFRPCQNLLRQGFPSKPSQLLPNQSLWPPKAWRPLKVHLTFPSNPTPGSAFLSSGAISEH